MHVFIYHILPISKPEDIRMGPHPPYIPGLETCELRAPPPTSLVWKLPNPFLEKKFPFLEKNCTSAAQSNELRDAASFGHVGVWGCYVQKYAGFSAQCCA